MAFGIIALHYCYYSQQQQKHTELPSSWQVLPKLPMRQFGIIVLHYWYYSHWLWRESGLWFEWRVFSSLAGLNSVFKNALQNAKQLFSTGIPQMTKNCIMRECENILNGYLYGGDLLFVILKGIYGLNSPKGFWRSLPEISLLHFFFSSLVNLKTLLPNHWCLFPSHSQGLKPCTHQSTFSQ